MGNVIILIQIILGLPQMSFVDIYMHITTTVMSSVSGSKSIYFQTRLRALTSLYTFETSRKTSKYPKSSLHNHKKISKQINFDFPYRKLTAIILKTLTNLTNIDVVLRPLCGNGNPKNAENNDITKIQKR